VNVGELREQLEQLPDKAEVWVRDNSVKTDLFCHLDKPARRVRRLRTRLLASKIVTIEFGPLQGDALPG
jgi:hypothetical protein